MKPRRRRVLAERVVAAHGVKGIHAVVDVDLMPAAAKCLAEPIDVGGIAAEAVRPEKRRDHAELHRRPPCRAASRMPLIVLLEGGHRPPISAPLDQVVG